MQTLPSNLVIAGLGPFAELFGIVVVVALFTLLRSQADRRSYFKAWEESWVMLAVGLTAAVIYQRLTDVNSVLYPGTPPMTWFFAAAYFVFRLFGLSLLIAGGRLFTEGARDKWLTRVAIGIALVLSMVVDTFHTQLGSLGLFHGPFALASYIYVAALFASLPLSRRSAGTRLMVGVLVGLSALWIGLLVFYLFARMGNDVATLPWFVRFERYGFFTELALQFALAYAMVRLLFEDAGRERTDTRAQLELMQDRDRLADLYDQPTGLLNRRAFDTAVGLDFAKASFGSIVRVRLTNVDESVEVHGSSIGSVMVTQFAALLDNAVRAHDRVYRWADREFLVVMPRATPAIARKRMEFLLARAAPLAVSAARQAVRAGASLSVAPFTGAEDLTNAMHEVSSDPKLA
jgi:GGDEF domain-containing protein